MMLNWKQITKSKRGAGRTALVAMAGAAVYEIEQCGNTGLGLTVSIGSKHPLFIRYDDESFLKIVAQAHAEHVGKKIDPIAEAAINTMTYGSGALLFKPDGSVESVSPLDMAAERKEWRCFHCDELFQIERDARLHFGEYECSDPACKIKAGAEMSMLVALRRAETEAQRAIHGMHDESSEGWKAYHSVAGRLSEQVRAAEELGYERGLRDGRKEVSHQSDDAEKIRWLVEEHLPGGSAVWSCFEHELQAKQFASSPDTHNATTITRLASPSPAPEAEPVASSAEVERWQKAAWSLSHSGMSFRMFLQVYGPKIETITQTAIARKERKNTPTPAVDADAVIEAAAERHKHVGQGMAIAAGILMRVWGSDTEAREILNAAGYKTLDDLRRDEVDEYDIEALEPALSLPPSAGDKP